MSHGRGVGLQELAVVAVMWCRVVACVFGAVCLFVTGVEAGFVIAIHTQAVFMAFGEIQHVFSRPFLCNLPWTAPVGFGHIVPTGVFRRRLRHWFGQVKRFHFRTWGLFGWPVYTRCCSFRVTYRVVFAHISSAQPMVLRRMALCGDCLAQSYKRV